MPVKNTTTKEDGETKRRRRQSADDKDSDEESMTQGGLALSQAGDGDDVKGGGECR